MADSPRQLVEEVLARDMTREIWSGNYDKVLPVSVQGFELSAVLPAVFYMFRFGHRRGVGKFLKIFGLDSGTPSQKRRSATIERVAKKLAGTNELHGFAGETEKAILGDLLLCFCLENVRRGLGRDRQIQRVFPAHYMASWLDLPQLVVNLRYVPEMIVAMLANQKGDYVESKDGKKTWFAVGRGYEDNVLLRAFSQGVTRHGDILDDRASDGFEESDDSVGLDQLLMIRLARQLRSAPDKIRGKEGNRISNQHPIAAKAAREFSDDIRRFLRSYATSIPRHALVDMLESCIAVGMTTVLTSTVEILFQWVDTGEVPNKNDQHCTHLFVDCSNGIDRHLRLRAEQSMDDAMRRMERFPVVLMALRLLDYQARSNRRIKNEKISIRPYATSWVNLLGDLLHERHREATRVHHSLEDKAELLSDKLLEDYPEVAGILGNADSQPNPVWRLADGMMALVGPRFIQDFRKLIDSSLLAGRPNGLANKRSTTRGGGVKRRKRDVRSLVFTDPVLDYLVHLHLLPNGNRSGFLNLSFGDFIDTLHERYGFHVDTAPPGMTISNQLLQKNRAILERRLRDLGLLVGVNDAEAMKRLQPRFERVGES